MGRGRGDDASCLPASRGVSTMAAANRNRFSNSIMKFVKHLGRRQFGFVTEVMLPMGGSRHAEKLDNNVMVLYVDHF